ncbi:MAG: IS5 family transposase [Vulcanimicrobiaceae bacterium]
MLPGRPGSVGRNSELGNRLFVEAVIWKFRSGAPWRDLPERFGGWKNVHTRFSRWAKKGVWENLFKALANDPDNEYAMIDATIVRAHQHSAGAQKNGGGEAIGRSRGGLTTKIHAIVDALGNPLAIRLTGGQAHDITQAEALLAEVEPQALIADKAYDADGFIDALTIRRIEPVIPPKANRKASRECDFALYSERHLIERFFNALKQFRGIATRHEKTARNFLAVVHLACALARLK